MLSALIPNENVYDITKYYKKISRTKLKKQPKNPLNKLSLPKLTSSKILEQNLSKILTISCKNSVKINKVNLKYNNLQNNPVEIKKEENYVRSPVLSESNKNISESNKNIKLPKLQKKKKIFSEKNSPQKPQKSQNIFSCLYLKYEGENYYNEINKKIYIKIFPQKIIHSIKNIMDNDKTIINKIEQKINKIMVDKYTTMSNLNYDFKTITINLNEIIDSAENKYILLTENNNNSNKHLFRIKNIFLENIIQNVITHSIEIRNQKNNIILRAEIENELNNQLNLLKQFFVNEVNNKKHKRYSECYNKIDIKTIKMIRTQKHLLKTYNKIISSDFDESENYIDSVINKRDEGYLTERNNGNKEIFNLFKTKLDMTKNKTFHELYYNIITTNSSFNHNYISSTQTTTNFTNKYIKTNNNINIKKEKNGDINRNKENILNFYKKYLKIKEDLNIKNDKKDENQEYIFKFKPNLKFVEFKEIIDEINDINIKKKLNINKSINNEKLFFLIMSDESLLKEINFKNVKNKNASKFFSDKTKKPSVPKKKNKNIKPDLRIDVLKQLGDKLHKKLKIKLGRNKRRKKIKDLLRNKTGNKSKNTNGEDNYKSSLTENKFIDSETNSSVFSDIPSDLSMSYSEMKKQKEENAKKIKKVFQNQEMFDDANIIDIDELFFKKNEPEEKNNNDNNKNKSKEIDNNGDNEDNIDNANEINEEEEDDKDTFIVYDNKEEFDKKKVNITNLMIKDKIKKRKIKYIYVNNDLKQIKSIFNDKGNQTSINSLNNEKDKSNIINNMPSSKNISRNSFKVDNMKNTNNKTNKSHSNKKEIDEQKNEKSTSKKKSKIDSKSINKIKTRRNKHSKTKSTKSYFSEKITNENDIENDFSNIEYDQLILFFINKFNIPGKNNKIKKNYLSKSFYQQTNNDKASIYNESKSKKETFMNSIKGIQKDKLIRNKSFSFIKTRNDKKLILLKPILRHILYRKKSNLKKIRDTLNKIFSVHHVDMLDIDFDDEPNNQKKINTYKKMISFDDNGNYENYSNHRNLVEKYLGSRLKIEQKYYLDDIDLLLENKYCTKKKIYKRRKGSYKKGFKQFLNDDDINEIGHNYLDDFEERQKENERIRSYIEAEKEKKKRRIKAAEDKFNKFKSYINSLKNMTEEQLKFDAIRFIYKIKSDEDDIRKAKRIKRINDFKRYIKTNEMNKLNNNKTILKNVLFQSNCVFHTDKLFAL